MRNTPLVLAVLDGFGWTDSLENNAIAAAKTPHFEKWFKECPHVLLSASGLDVGLPQGQMGNSEVGHMHLGAGRVVYQELTRLDQAIKSKTFFDNPVLKSAIAMAASNHQKIHILGLLSPGGVHSHEAHLSAMVQMALDQGLGAAGVFVHAFLDGRDVPPQSAKASLKKLDDQLRASGRGKIASLIGRFYAMDRDKRWDRVQKAYDLLTQGKAEYFASSSLEGLEKAYERGESDEFVQATSIASPLDGEKPTLIESGDVIIFMNFRADRARELTHAFVDETFDSFPRGEKLALGQYITLTEYEANLPVAVAYPPQSLKNTLGEVAARAGLKQLRIAETEKYAHVTFFFNGGIETPFIGETRELIPSPKVATYDLKPEMSAYELTDALTKAVESREFDLIICNYANPDMVGHTGNFEATVRAIEVVDECLGRVVQSVEKMGGVLLMTADHGNAEKMFDAKTDQAHTAHTSNQVPLLLIGGQASMKATLAEGTLADVAPTVLSLIGLPIPEEMTGRVIFGHR